MAQLGNISRLKIFKLLVKAGENGLAVGSIQEKLQIPGSTLSHHITKLCSVDLLRQERSGRILNCTVNYKILNAMLKELKNQCCIGID